MNWFTALIYAATYALQIWASKIRYELTNQIETDSSALEANRDRLLATGDPADARRADRVQQSILRRQGIAASLPVPRNLPAAGAPAEGGESSPKP